MDIGAIVMAAGLGTRMRSQTPKMLHPLCGKPLIGHVLDLLIQAKVKKAAIVVSHHKEEIITYVKKQYPKAPFIFVDQKTPLGTGHAVLKTQHLFKNFKLPLVILSGDVPGLTLATLKAFVEAHVSSKKELTLATAILEASYPYGRVVRDFHDHVVKMVEAKDATEEELKISEMGVGLYCVNVEPLFQSLKKITPNNAKKEYYLTDMVGLIESKHAFVIQQKEEVMGINTREELSRHEKIFREKINQAWMLKGVTLLDPQTTYIDSEVKLSEDVLIYPQVHLYGKTTIGKNTMIKTGSVITDSHIGAQVTIKEYSVIEESTIEDQAIIGPFARLRPETKVKKRARVGNFVELKKTVLGDESKANHLTYLGDATIGKDVNVGCGVITCNYDGGLRYSGKAKTVIGDKSFIGSDCQLIAPLTLQKGSYVASGTTVTENVPKDSLVIARVKQMTKKGYMKKLWARSKKRKK